jgi:hypothetical protein
MTPATYRELFKAALEEQIAGGGDVGHMISLVNIYQGYDLVGRGFAFREWLATAPFACGRCSTAFTPNCDEVTEEDEALCVWCAHPNAKVGQEPMPGWRRTWAR